MDGQLIEAKHPALIPENRLVTFRRPGLSASTTDDTYRAEHQGRGGDMSWTSDGRGGGRRGSPAPVPLRLAELISLIGSARLREEVARGKGAMRLQSRSGDDHRAGFI